MTTLAELLHKGGKRKASRGEENISRPKFV